MVKFHPSRFGRGEGSTRSVEQRQQAEQDVSDASTNVVGTEGGSSGSTSVPNPDGLATSLPSEWRLWAAKISKVNVCGTCSGPVDPSTVRLRNLTDGKVRIHHIFCATSQIGPIRECPGFSDLPAGLAVLLQVKRK